MPKARDKKLSRKLKKLKVNTEVEGENSTSVKSVVHKGDQQESEPVKSRKKQKSNNKSGQKEKIVEDPNVEFEKGNNSKNKQPKQPKKHDDTKQNNQEVKKTKKPKKGDVAKPNEVKKKTQNKQVTPKQFKSRKVAPSKPTKPKLKLRKKKKADKKVASKNLLKCFEYNLEKSTAEHDVESNFTLDLTESRTKSLRKDDEKELIPNNIEVEDQEGKFNSNSGVLAGTDNLKTQMLVDPNLEGFDNRENDEPKDTYISDDSSDSSGEETEPGNETPSEDQSKDDGDSDIEILREIIKTPHVVPSIKTEIKNELDENPTHEVEDKSIKQEYEEKFMVQMSSQNHKLLSMEKTLKVLVNFIQEGNDERLKGLSKYIDGKPLADNILPKIIDLPSKEPDDEVIFSPRSSPSSNLPLSVRKRKKNLQEETSQQKKVKTHETSDEFFSPNRLPAAHLISDSETEGDLENENEHNKRKTNENTSNSGITSRMQSLNNFEGYERKSRSTGIVSHHSLDWSKNSNVPEEFWIKYSWADKTKDMCDATELDEYIVVNKLEYAAKDIAPWICTAWPIDLYERRYFSFNCENGDIWVSRTLAQSKNFFLKGKPLDPFDRCVICQKYLVSEYHVFMPVFKFEEGAPKTLIWKWQNSREKACFIHFESSKSEMILGRNPHKMNPKGGSRHSKFHDDLFSMPQLQVKQTDFKLPDEY